MKLLCVGERRSATAIRRGWTWADGHLAARTLHAALGALGLEYCRDYACCNILDDEGVLSADQLKGITVFHQHGWQIVALGQAAARYLARAGIPHSVLIHPAARGAMRKRERYAAHVAAIIQPLLTENV